MNTGSEPSSSVSLYERLDHLSTRAWREFVDVSDFFWKAPRLLHHERALELRKLDAYFSDHPEYKKLRWKLESHKLEHTFPYLIAVGNLFSALSLFESYLLLLANELQTQTGVCVRDVKGQGLSRLFAFLRKVAVTPERIQLYEQVQAAIKIRNCLMHASGMLNWSRENDDLRRIQTMGLYLSLEHRKIRTENRGVFDEVSISESALGDRLTIDNQYCHVLCSYLHVYFSSLCEAVQVQLKPTVDE